MRQKPEEKEKQFRALYEAFCKNPRIRKKEIAALLDVDRGTALTRVREAHATGWLSKSQIRLLSFSNFPEYSYFLKCEKPARLFSQLVDSENVIYHALLCGAANLWVIAKEKLTFPCECDVLLEGLRSDYYASFAPRQTWDTSIKKMEKKIAEFDLKRSRQGEIIETRWHETQEEWDKEFEIVFQEFNYDLSKKVLPISAKHHISREKVDGFVKNVSKYCTVITSYYPGGISSYDPYLFFLKTKYEDFIVELFSELPTTTLFFKVSDTLFALAYVRSEGVRVLSSQTHIRELQIPSMMMNLLERGIISSEDHAIVECHWHSRLEQSS